ncbi:hypothetical protein [Paenibacillus aestuarii]|uniref:Uncharacterized protein n=1 Tax=Paenibacillus aestuarii TaxID=516965 RepID=A0ABW0KI88_9BACL|nr:hypothetical protein [Paenibacillus aestuarii]
MGGRNNSPKNRGPSSSPGRLDQYGERAAQEEKQEMKERQNRNNC